MTGMRGQPSRPGFTLLEMLLALGLGVVLLGALYVALQTTLQQTQATRDVADVEGLSRAVFNRVGVDLANVLGPPPPKSGGGVPDTASATGAAPATMTPPTPSSGTSGTDPAAAAEPEAESEAPAADPAAGGAQPAANLPLQLGVFGDATRLSVFASRVAPVLGGQQPADLVRIDYWLAAGGGLCRKETPWVTAQGVWSGEALESVSEGADVIAEEVTGATFEYFDGTDWAESWSGGGGSVPAPPRAVRVTLSFSFPNPRGGDPLERTVSQVLVVRTAPGSVTPELTDPVVSSGTDTAAQDAAGTGSGATGSGASSAGAGSSGGSGSGVSGSSSSSAGSKPSGSSGGAGSGATSSGGTSPSGGGSGGGGSSISGGGAGAGSGQPAAGGTTGRGASGGGGGR